MDIFGIGPLELFFIFLIALIVLGPKDMVKAGRSLGKLLRRIVTSQEWRTVQQASREIRRLPTTLMREAGMDEIQANLQDIKKNVGDLKGDLQTWQEGITTWTTPPEIPDLGAALKEAGADLPKDISSWTTPSPRIAPPEIPVEEVEQPEKTGE